MPKVLIVSYWFAPLESIGATRVNNFAKHLNEWGWEVKVLSVKPSEWAHDGNFQDIENDFEVVGLKGFSWAATLRKLSGGRLGNSSKIAKENQRFTIKGQILKFMFWIYNSLLCLPDDSWPWYILGRRQALREAKVFDPDIILSSAMPFSSHILASYLQKKIQRPWVADYRDLWVGSGRQSKGRSIDAFHYKIQKSVMKNCSHLIAASRAWSEELAQDSGLPSTWIYNGYEGDVEAVSKKESNDRSLVLSYTGRCYVESQSPELIFEMLNEADSRVSFRYCGPNKDLFDDLANKHNVKDRCEIQGMLSKAEAQQVQNSADVLILLTCDVAGWIPAKIYEYLRTNKPIIVLGPHHKEVHAILQETQTMRTIDEIQIAENIRLVESSQRTNAIKEYSRLMQNEKLDSLLKSLI